MDILYGERLSGLLGTGEGGCYADGQLDELISLDGEEAHLYRAMCDAEYDSIVANGNTFVEYEWALEKKWFAVSSNHAVKWADLFYPDGVYKIIEITVLKEALKYMFFVKMLDNIGPAYSADVDLLNMTVRRLRLL